MDSFWFQIVFTVSFLVYGLDGQSLRQCYTCIGPHCISPLEFKVTNCTTATDQCVTIYDGYTPVKRACYSALSAAEKTACDNTANVQCSKCATDVCNDLGRIDHTCVTCSSVKNRTCLTSPGTYAVTRCAAPLYSGTPSCYIKANGDSTQRGCIITQKELNECTANATHDCSACSTQGCNTYEFPVGRRKCYRGATVQYCDNANDNCFAYNFYGEKNSICSGEVDNSVREFCELNPFLCMECLDDGCNTNVSFSIQCRKCDSSSTDTNCAGKPNQSTLTDCTDGCVTYVKNETGSVATTHRSCYENIPDTLKAQCKSGNGLCESCFNNDCNSNIFPKNRQFCYQCESTGCNATVTSTVCASYSSTDKCVSVMKNGQPNEFSCLSTFNRTKSCANTKSCVVSECSASGCNAPTAYAKSTSCVQCNTSTNTQCTTEPNLVGSMPCKQSVDTCYTMVQAGNVIRGCLSDLDINQQTSCRTNCDLCNSTAGGCNNQIYPANRLYCHQCDSRMNKSCDQSINTLPSMCLNYNADNKCIALLTKNGTFIRTCASDQTAACKDAVVCSACDKYGCNNAKIEENGSSNDDSGSVILRFSTFLGVVLITSLFILNVN